MLSHFFPFVTGNSLHQIWTQRLQALLDALPNFRGCIALQSIEHDIPYSPFHDHAECRFVAFANDEVTFTMARDNACVHVFGSTINETDICEFSRCFFASFLASFALLAKLL